MNIIRKTDYHDSLNDVFVEDGTLFVTITVTITANNANEGKCEINLPVIVDHVNDLTPQELTTQFNNCLKIARNLFISKNQ